MDRAQDRIAIFSASAVIVVGICKNVVTIPVVLQKAMDLRSLRYAATTCLSEFCGQDISFDQSPMLDCCGEERRACKILESAAPSQAKSQAVRQHSVLVRALRSLNTCHNSKEIQNVEIYFKDIHTTGFFPDIKSGLVPVLGYVIKIIGDDGPNR